MLDSGTNVIVWHTDLKSNPAENASEVLAYHNKGLLAWFGHQWVCWGDLRTEYIPSKELEVGCKRREPDSSEPCSAVSVRSDPS